MPTKLLSVLRRHRPLVQDALLLTGIILVAGIVAYTYSFSEEPPDDYRVELVELLLLGALTFAGICFFGWRRAIEQEKQQEKLEVALNNMSRGLAMFDSDQRLEVCNKLYAEMYGLTLEQVKPGTSVREILEHRVANQCYNATDANHIVDRLVTNFGRIDAQVHELSDGRIVNVSHRRASSGSHIITHDDVTEQHRAVAKIAYMARHDALTGLPNRAHLKEQLDHALAGARRGERFAVHLLDLDHFKNVNDTLGHPAGDQLLQMATERLRKLVRDKDTVARMGGDEFVILQVGIAQPADVSSLALRAIDDLAKPYTIEGQDAVVAASVGIALAPEDGLDADQLMRNADLALYRAKGEGRGTFRFFEQGMDAQMQSRRILEQDLRGALTQGEFELYYQPVVHLGRNAISGFEALLRWNHPQRGKVPPIEFIPLAEETALIIPIGEWVLREGCQTAVAWPPNLTIAINLSAVQFRSPGLLQAVKDALSASRLPAERLVLEITETALLEDTEGTLAILYLLRELGVRIAMDDFGTGYSSLSYLQSFPFDKIKIDRSFIKDIADGVGSLNIVRAVAAMAHGLGMETVAEGVETAEQCDIVKFEGCTEMQGYLFSKPMPANEIAALLLRTKTKELSVDAA